MSSYKFMYNSKSKAGATRSRRPFESREQIFARLGRQAGPGIVNADDRGCADLSGSDCQSLDHGRITSGVAGHSLNRVAAQIGDDTEELVGIDIDFKVGRNQVLEFDLRISRRG